MKNKESISLITFVRVSIYNFKNIFSTNKTNIYNVDVLNS